MAAGSLWQRARFMAGLVLQVAARALPHRRPAAAEDPEQLIEALQTGDLACLDRLGPGLAKSQDSLGNPWFFIALETGSLSVVRWFLANGADPNAADRSARLPLEVIVQRIAESDLLDDHLDDGPAMVAALLAAGANPEARSLLGETMADLAGRRGLL